MLALLLSLLISPAQAQTGCVQRDITITQSTRLDPNCRYLGTTSVTGSNLVLDCAGAVLDGEYRARYTLQIGPAQPVTNVEIRNCRVTGARREGIGIGRKDSYARDALKPGSSEPDPAQYAQRITLRQVDVRRNAGAGIYINGFVRGTEILDATITENSNVGIYVTHHSTGTRIADSRIIGNGTGVQGGVPGASRGWREGIAIDSSAGNIIENNQITGNKAGGILLYRNCGEGSMDIARVRERPASAHNIIRGNTIAGSPVGIGIASRQDSRVACTMPLDPAHGVFTDAAPDNEVVDNRLSRVGTGIRAADDGNILRGNDISAKDDCLLLGSVRRQEAGRPVAGLVARDNRCRSGGTQVVPGTGFARGGDPRD